MQKERVYVIMLKIALVLVKIYVLVRKKSISRWAFQIAQKHTAYVFPKLQTVKVMVRRMFK